VGAEAQKVIHEFTLLPFKSQLVLPLCLFDLQLSVLHFFIHLLDLEQHSLVVNGFDKVGAAARGDDELVTTRAELALPLNVIDNDFLLLSKDFKKGLGFGLKGSQYLSKFVVILNLHQLPSPFIGHHNLVVPIQHN
jgi:hypothetical protein